MNPTALALFIIAALVLFLAVTGRLDATAAALQGQGLSHQKGN